MTWKRVLAHIGAFCVITAVIGALSILSLQLPSHPREGLGRDDADRSVRHAISVAREVVFVPKGGQYAPHEVYAVMRNDDTHLLMRSLATCGGWHDKPRSKSFDFTFEITLRNIYDVAPYSYDSNTGELGSDSQWCKTPDSFREEFRRMYVVKRALPKSGD